MTLNSIMADVMRYHTEWVRF